MKSGTDPGRTLYEQAVLLLEEGADLPRARALLEQAVARRPAHARSHALLGHVHDLESNAPVALASFREALRLDPDDPIPQVYALALLAEMGHEAEALAGIEAAAPQHGVDMDGLRHELAAAKMPADARTLLVNGFLHPRNYFRSWLADEAERIQNHLDPKRAGRLAKAQRDDCRRFQQDLGKSFDASRVPQELQGLARWASRYGIGDDHCRPYLLKRLNGSQKETLIRLVDAHAEAIDRWLGTFPPGELSTEAAAFLYLAQGVEEIGR